MIDIPKIQTRVQPVLSGKELPASPRVGLNNVILWSEGTIGAFQQSVYESLGLSGGIEQEVHMVGHGVYTAAMATIFILAVLCLVFLVRYFSQPVAVPKLRKIPYAWTRAPLSPSQDAESVRETRPGQEKDTFIVIPDISGYTRFIKLNRFSVGHAQYLVSELLTAITDAAQPWLRATRVEGDAVVLHAISARGDARGGVTGDQIGKAILHLLQAFYRKRAELKVDNVCPCEACSHVDDLDIKVIAHRGLALHYSVKNFEDLSGLSVIVAHRLLKNSLSKDRYVLVTEAARDIELPLIRLSERQIEHYDGLGEIAFRVYDFDPQNVVPELPSERHCSIVAKIGNTTWKLAENARTLKRTFHVSA